MTNITKILEELNNQMSPSLVVQKEQPAEGWFIVPNMGNFGDKKLWINTAYLNYQLRQSLTALLDEVRGEMRETGIKKVKDKKTGKEVYLHGRSPTSVCIGCGQKKSAEQQGYNQREQELRDKLKDLKL